MANTGAEERLGQFISSHVGQDLSNRSSVTLMDDTYDVDQIVVSEVSFIHVVRYDQFFQMHSLFITWDNLILVYALNILIMLFIKIDGQSIEILD